MSRDHSDTSLYQKLVHEFHLKAEHISWYRSDDNQEEVLSHWLVTHMFAYLYSLMTLLLASPSRQCAAGVFMH